MTCAGSTCILALLLLGVASDLGVGLGGSRSR
jgi:hypothetical protein